MASRPAMPDAAQHIFKPLNYQKREIRLVRIGPSRNFEGPLICRHTHVSLSARPMFEALSWCWGDPTDVEPITLEGHLWNAPVNLVQALKFLRYPDRERSIWVDGLSINQARYKEALLERAQQIQLMKYIYSLATTTIIWMGDPPEDLANFLLMALVDGQSVKRSLRDDPNDALGHMINILLLPWWRRCWVVQEGLLAKAPIFQFGTLTVPMQHLLTGFGDLENHVSASAQRSESYQILTLLMQETVTIYSHLLGSFSGLPAQHRQALALAQMGRYQSSVVSNRSKPFYDLTEVLVQCRYFSTTDERDKVWGFLGLTTDAVSLKLDPGYELPLATIYIHTTRKLIHSSGSLYILSQCQPTKPSLEHLPSWVPDWTIARRDGDPHEWNHGPSREDREYIHNAALGQAAQNPEAGWSPEPCKHIPTSDVDKVIPLRGLRYVWIEKLLHELSPCNDIYDWWTKTRPWRQAFLNAHSIKPPSDKGGLFSKFKSEKSNRKAKKEHREIFKAVLHMYWDTMLQGTMPRSFDPGKYIELPKRDKPNRQSSSKDDDDEEEESEEDEVYEAKNRFGSIKHRFGQMVAGQVVACNYDTLVECRRWGQAVDDGEEYNPDLDLDALFEHLKKTTVGRRFFVAGDLHGAGNQCGLGPSNLQRLDEVWILAGGSHPFALTPYGRSPINPSTSMTGEKSKYLDMRFKLVGELYLAGDLQFGPMDGGVVQAASSDVENEYWLPQRRSNNLWWPPMAHRGKERINLGSYWWDVWLY